MDENLNWRLEYFLPGNEVKSVPRIGWAGLKNGKLLSRAQGRFDVLLTMDGLMASQQNLTRLQFSIIALVALSNRLEDTSSLMPKVLKSLPTLKPGKVLRIGA